MRNPPSCQLQTSEGDGEEGKEGTGRRGCGSGASHPLTFTSPAAPGALLPPRAALLSPQGPRLPRLPRVPRRPPRGEAGRGGGYVRASPRTAASTPRPEPPLARGKGEGAAGRAPELPEALAACVEPSSSVLSAFPPKP